MVLKLMFNVRYYFEDYMLFVAHFIHWIRHKPDYVLELLVKI